jgi:hypothetical protein
MLALGLQKQHEENEYGIYLLFGAMKISKYPAAT